MYTEQSLHLCASLGNCVIAEHMHWFGLLFNESIELKNGMIQIPNRPGLGFTLNQTSVRKYLADV